jgi:hypothetical protein
MSADQAHSTGALWLKNSGQAERDRQIIATVAALAEIGPRDELEGMMDAQLLAAHNEKVNVEHVHVHAGGQAVIGQGL